MKAIILAAGRGSRMKKMTDDRPKCLVELHGKPLIEWQVNALKGAGINDIGIVTGYKREMLSNKGFTEFYNDRWSTTNMVTSLCCANDWLNSTPCIVSYSDIFYEKSAIEILLKSNSCLSVAYDPNWLSLWIKRFGDPLLDAETFKLSSVSLLTEIGNKPNSISEIDGQYMGILKFTPRSWNEILKIRSTLSQFECDSIHMTGTLQKVIENKNIDIEAIPYFGLWGEVDNIEDLKCYE